MKHFIAIVKPQTTLLGSEMFHSVCQFQTLASVKAMEINVCAL